MDCFLVVDVSGLVAVGMGSDVDFVLFITELTQLFVIVFEFKSGNCSTVVDLLEETAGHSSR